VRVGFEFHASRLGCAGQRASLALGHNDRRLSNFSVIVAKNRSKWPKSDIKINPVEDWHRYPKPWLTHNSLA
jgi:hypothetical protein